MTKKVFILLMASATFSCKLREFPSVATTSGTENVTVNDILNPSGLRFTPLNECLIEIHDDLNPFVAGAGNLDISPTPPHSDGTCLPKSKLTWLLPVVTEETVKEFTRPDMAIAVLFDTSYSLRAQDPKKERYGALKQYLTAIFDEVGVKINSATIKVFAFKYCNVEGEFEITNSTDISRVVEEIKKIPTDGSTNYLQSFALASDWLNHRTPGGVPLKKQMVIISDGLPFTFNDGSQNVINTSQLSTCGIEEEHSLIEWETLISESLAKGNKLISCVNTGMHYPDGSTCQAPVGASNPSKANMGVTDNPKMYAYDDPRNHILGMIQHSYIMKNGSKKDGFDIYAVHLNNCRQVNVTNFSETFLCKAVSDNFFESFTARNGYYAVDNASNLAKTLEKVLIDQTKTRTYGSGKAKVSGVKASAVEVDSDTEVIEDGRRTFIRVKEGTEAFDFATVGDEVQLASGWATHTLRLGKLSVAQKIGDVDSGSAPFNVDYIFEFETWCASDNSKWESGTISTVGEKGKITPMTVEVHRFWNTGNKNTATATAWCVLMEEEELPSPVPTPSPTPHTHVEGTETPEVDEDPKLEVSPPPSPLPPVQQPLPPPVPEVGKNPEIVLPPTQKPPPKPEEPPPPPPVVEEEPPPPPSPTMESGIVGDPVRF